MNILNLGHNGVNQRMRNAEMESLGHKVLVDSVYPKDSSAISTIERKLAERFGAKNWIEHANTDLLERSKAWKDIDLIWIDKAIYIYKDTVEQIKRNTNAVIVHYTPDMHFLNSAVTQMSPIFHDAVSAYDFVITTKEAEIDSYKCAGATNVLLCEQLVSHRVFYPRKDYNKNFVCELGFVGRSEKYYVDTIKRVWDSGVRVAARGYGWDRLLFRFDPRYKKFCLGGPVMGEEYVRCLSAMNLGLGLLTRYGPEVSTTRSLEIPACGTFLLAERTEKHLEMFEEGKEAEFFSSTDELIEKSRFYLKNASLREKIAEGGYRKFLNGGLRADRQLSVLLSAILP